MGRRELNGGNIVYSVTRSPCGYFAFVAVFSKEPKWYVGSWVAGFDRRIFVGVDAFADGKTGS